MYETIKRALDDIVPFASANETVRILIVDDKDRPFLADHMLDIVSAMQRFRGLRTSTCDIRVGPPISFYIGFSFIDRKDMDLRADIYGPSSCHGESFDRIASADYGATVFSKTLSESLVEDIRLKLEHRECP